MATPRVWALAVGLVVLGLLGNSGKVDAAKLAAIRAARDEAAAKLEKAKSPEELKREKMEREQLKADIQNLLKDSKEYRALQLKKQQEEQVAEFDPAQLEGTDLWRKEYESFMKAERRKYHWGRFGIASGLASGVGTGLAGFAKAQDNTGRAGRFVKTAGTVALLTGAGALVAWLTRRHNQKKQKLHNARLARMQFEARTGLKPSDENVLGPDESEIISPKKKSKKREDEE